jgi:2-iminobutanoate/2-iminopropanoate deaminase
MPKVIPSLPGIEPIFNPLAGEVLPISNVVEVNGLVFVAGQSGHLPGDRQLPAGGVAAETRLSLEKIGRILVAAGLDFKDVVKANVFLADFDDLEKARMEMNAVYREFFSKNPPVRCTVGVAALPLGGHVEIEVIAAR